MYSPLNTVKFEEENVEEISLPHVEAHNRISAKMIDDDLHVRP